MKSFQNWLESETILAFQALGFDEKRAVVKSADRPDLGDYQLNSALVLAKKNRELPSAIAKKIVDVLAPRLLGVDLSISGPGFINFTISLPCLVACANNMAPDRRLGVQTVKTSKTIFIDYGGPNAAKPMHVGHLRSSIIGEAMKRILAFQGHNVIGDIHLGDWGMQMGMLIQGLKEQYGREWAYCDVNFDIEAHDAPSITLEELEILYPKIAARAKEDSEFAELCRTATQKLQQGHLGYRALWKHFVDVSVSDMKVHFEVLNVSFEQWFGESRYQPHLQNMVDALVLKGVAVPSKGAVIVPVTEATDSMDIPPLLLQKSDGGFLYGTTELATIYERVNTFKADQIIYVVDGRQKLHFKQVLRAAHRAGLDVDMHLMGFGTMNGPDNKPFKTRTGGVMKLGDLIHLLRNEARDRIDAVGMSQGFPEEEKADIAEKIAVATLKFSDLQHDPKQNYQFSLDKFMRFEGKTGPYLLYAAVRIKSILRKAGLLHEGADLAPISEDLNTDERALIFMLVRFPEVIDIATMCYSPNVLCTYVFEVSQCFSRFYQSSPVLSADEGANRASRLTICALSLNTILIILDLLGINVPERM